MFASASFAFALAAAPAPQVTEARTEWGPVVVVRDDRVPLAWVRLAFPVGRYHDLPGKHDPELLWRAVVGVALAEAEIQADVHPWMTAEACGVDALFLVSDQQEVIRDLAAVLEAQFSEVYVPRSLVRAGWRDLRGVPDHALDQAIARAFYAPRDPRREAVEPPRGPVYGSALLALRDEVVAASGAAFGLAGAVDPDDGAEVVRRLFRSVPKREAPRPASALLPLTPADRRPTEVVLRADGLEQVLLAWARPGYASDDPRAGAAVLADEALRAGIEQLAREERGDAYAVSTFGILDLAPGAWQVRTGTSVERAAGLAGAIEAWLAQVATDGLPPEALARARASLEAAARARTRAPYDVLADEVGRHLALDAPRPDELVDQALLASDEAVQAVARELADPAGLVRFRVLPIAADDPIQPTP